MTRIQDEESVLIAIDGLHLDRKLPTISQIADKTELSMAETELVCRRLFRNGFLSFVRHDDNTRYVELTSIGDIRVKQLIES